MLPHALVREVGTPVSQGPTLEQREYRPHDLLEHLGTSACRGDNVKLDADVRLKRQEIRHT